MRAHVPEFGDEPYPDDGTVQVYAPIDLALNPELAAALPTWRTRIEEATTGYEVAVVGDDKIHVTVDVWTGFSAGQITRPQLETVATRLRGDLAQSPAYLGAAGPALAYGSSIRLDICPAAPLIKIQRQVHHGLAAERGPAAARWRQPKPHISQAFWRDREVCGEPIQRALTQIDPAHVPLRIHELVMAVVLFNRSAATGEDYFQWHTVARIPLGAA